MKIKKAESMHFGNPEGSTENNNFLIWSHTLMNCKSHKNNQVSLPSQLASLRLMLPLPPILGLQGNLRNKGEPRVDWIWILIPTKRSYCHSFIGSPPPPCNVPVTYTPPCLQRWWTVSKSVSCGTSVALNHIFTICCVRYWATHLIFCAPVFLSIKWGKTWNSAWNTGITPFISCLIMYSMFVNTNVIIALLGTGIVHGVRCSSCLPELMSAGAD